MSYKIPNRRPMAPKKFVDGWTSDDFHTRSKIEIEYYACDCFKIILLMTEQLMMIERLQKEDILAVIERDMDRHFIEEDV